ncbi:MULTISPECIES: ABC transporter permease [unclassified Pseudomonas]|uniref:ABC transporter permease n=1 Tax=unclassified Pseudomonas TaxID=196821 RepID=UPI0025D672C9|nr:MULTISPECIES: ABC transporter permease [unclassified Pseudomonas]
MRIHPLIGEASTVSALQPLHLAPLPSRLRWPTFSRHLLPWVVPVGVLALWWLASHRHWMSPQILPSPDVVWNSLLELAGGELWDNLWISLARLVRGVAAGTFIGALLGAWLGSSRRAERMVLPTFTALAQIPTLAWTPFFMVCFGIGETLKMAVLIKAVMVPVMLHTLVGVRDAQPRLHEAASVLRLSRAQRLRRLILPAALPSFMAGVRLALSTGWASLLAVELLASSEGLGYLMVWARQLFMLDIVFVCILLIGVLGVVLDRGTGWVDRRLVFWPHAGVAQLQRQRVGTWQERALAWALPLAGLALWQLASSHEWVDPNLLVSPWQVLQVTLAGLADSSLLMAMAMSLQRTLAGLVIGGLLGLLTGLLLGLCPRAERLLGPSFSALRQIAIFAWVPLITAWFGLGEGAKWAFVSMAAFFPLLIATQRSVAQAPAQLTEAAQVLKLDLWQRLRWLTLPAAAPGIFAGLRLALIFAWLGTIGAEYFMPSNGGIGSLMIGAQQLMRMDQILSAMLLIGLTGNALNALGQTLEHRATRWRHA